MAQFSYLPYLIGLVWLSACIILFEIAYFQWGNGGVLLSGRGNFSVPQENRKWPKDDFNTLIDIKNDFEFLINQEPCPLWRSLRTNKVSPIVLVLVLVQSAPDNFEKRVTIRETWGNITDPAMKLYFLLGSVDSPNLQIKIRMENVIYGDLIQGSFADTYRHLTYKHVMALKWFSYYCADTPLLLKTDDDTFVNSPALMKYVRSNCNNIRTRGKLIMGAFRNNTVVVRSDDLKWWVSEEEYPARVYPPYCLGDVLLYSSDMVQELYREAQKTEYFWIDDVHITGTLVRQINATLTPFGRLRLPMRYLLRKPKGGEVPLFTNFDLSRKVIRVLWQAVAGDGL